MPELQFGRSTYRRDQGNLPELQLINAFIEKADASQLGYVLQSRPGLVESYTVAGDGITGIYAKAGVFGGVTFTLAGNALYQGSLPIGSVNGIGQASFAGGDLAGGGSQLLVTRGQTITRLAATVATVTFPDGADVAAVAYLGGYFIAARSGTKAFYWSAVLNGALFDPLDFASAETAPDGLVDLAVVNDELWLLGNTTIEVWVQTANGELPFTRSEGRLYLKGTRAVGCSVVLDNTLIFVGNDNIVYRAAQVPTRVSGHGIEERISQSASCSAFGFKWQGHEFFCVRLDTATYGYDLSSNEWCEFKSWNGVNWRAGCAAQASNESEPAFGDATAPRVLSFGNDNDLGDPREVLFSAAFPLEGGVAIVDALRLSANVGRTGRLTGTEADPQVEMRYSNDAGATWGEWDAAPLGAQGEYRERIEWRRIGMFDDPGAMFEFRTTADAPFRVSGVAVNPASGGRSR